MRLYTPRPYVETLVRATIMDVLEPEWAAIEERIGELQEGSPPYVEEGLPTGVKGEGTSLATEEGLELAVAFHARLSSIRVLDPACGTGNFLYVSMVLMQALEARVIETIQTLGGEV